LTKEFTLSKGGINKEVAKLSSLTRLHIYDCHELTGTIASEFGLLSNLEQIYISYNGLSGSLPEVGQLTKLADTSFAQCQFTGTIPTSFLKLTALTNLALGYNSITGNNINSSPFVVD
jgi:Leucine-rich repeat (LRR) protein